MRIGKFGNRAEDDTQFEASEPATSAQEFTLGGIKYRITPGGGLLSRLTGRGDYSTTVSQLIGENWVPVTGNGTAPAALQISEAIRDPRFSSWLSTDDPSIPYDDLMRATWAIDPTQALAVYGQQAARKPGGVDPTPDTAWFTDEKYWPTVMSGFDGSMPALNQAVAQLKTSTPQTQAALNQWRNEMSPGAQSARNDPDEGLFGLGDFGTVLGLGALAFGIPYGLEALGLEGFGGGLASGFGPEYAGYLAGGESLGLGGVGSLTGAGTGLGAVGGLAGMGSSTGGAMDFVDLFSGLGDTTADWLPTATGWDYGPLSDTLLSGGIDPVSGMTLNQMSPGLWDSLTNYVTNNPGSTVKNALNALTGGGNSGLLSSALSGLGGYLTGNSAVDAARTSADAQIRAAQIAADAAKFKPIGVTSRFGSSNFGYDANGNLKSAGYTLTPEMKAQQDKMMAASGGALDQYLAGQQAAAPMGAAGQRAMTLGQRYLDSTPQEQAARYMAEQQALLAPSRERDLAALQTKLMQQGRLGLATGGTSTGMMAANPDMEAFYNAQRMQDLQLAANATQGGMDYAKFGAGMVGTGGDLLKGMYGAQTAAYQPYQTALGGAQTIEGLGQNALTLGMDMGRTVTGANAAAGGLLAQGMTNAAQTMQPANSYSPWGAMLSGAGNTIQNYNTQQQQNDLLMKLLSGSGTSGWGG